MEMVIVQVMNIHEVPKLVPAKECEGFVGGRIPEIQPPAEILVRFNGEKSKGTVKHPLQFRAAPAPAHKGAAKGFLFPTRSEERRVGKECRSRWWPYD